MPSTMTSRVRVVAGLALSLLTVACGGSGGAVDVPGADPGWQEGQEEGSRQPWLFALHSEYVVHADEVTFDEETTSPSGSIPYLRFDIDTTAEARGVPEGLRHPRAGAEIAAFESLGFERHPSVLEERATDVYVLLGAQEEAVDPEGEPLPLVNVVAAFSLGDGDTVDFLGPFADDIERELAEAQEVAGPAGATPLAFLMTLLGELEATGGDPNVVPEGDSILGRMAAERDARNDPEVAWRRAPVDQRALDPELTPPSVLAELIEGRIYVANDDEWEPGTILRLQTDMGISLQVDLSAGFSDGYVVLTPPESTWQIQVGNEEDGSDTWETLVEVPASRWSERGAIAVSVTAGRAAVETISVDEFDQRVDESAVQLPGG